jgi:hypothetical protein
MIKRLLNEQKGISTTAIAFAICVVFLITFVVGAVEYFIPLQKYSEFKDACRETLYKMELTGYLDASNRNSLNSKLAAMGVVSMTGNTNDFISGVTTSTIVKQGTDVRLYVQARFTYSKLFFLTRSDRTETFTYDRTMVRRTITN